MSLHLLYIVTTPSTSPIFDKTNCCVWANQRRQTVFNTRCSAFFFSHDNRTFEIKNSLKKNCQNCIASSFATLIDELTEKHFLVVLSFAVFLPGQKLKWYISKAHHKERSTHIKAKLPQQQTNQCQPLKGQVFRRREIKRLVEST